MKRILVTGGAGFIGYHLIKTLLSRGDKIVAIDNLNDYYDPQLKYDRLGLLGIDLKTVKGDFYYSSIYPDLKFQKMDISDEENVSDLFKEEFDIVCHLAAQAGVRYSLENPKAYIQSNIVGFFNLIDKCRTNEIEHFVYASSSSVYGLNGDVPYSESSSIAHPVSLYAASKKSNELIAHSYSHLYNIPTTGLRFFTVYGPWGRPDMSPFIFTNAILNNHLIHLFNHGDMIRDFTYVDDIIDGVIRVIDCPPQANNSWDPTRHDPSFSTAPYKIYNIGNSTPVMLNDFISEIEKCCNKKAIVDLKPMQPGDVYQTNADTTLLQTELNYRPTTSIKDGVEEYVEWFKTYYKQL